MKTKTEIIETVSDWITETVAYEIGKRNYDTDSILEVVDEEIYQTIYSMQEVIYTYKAKEISDIIGIYDAFDESDFSGERFEDWSQVAFANIYQLICDELDIMGMVETLVKKHQDND